MHTTHFTCINTQYTVHLYTHITHSLPVYSIHPLHSTQSSHVYTYCSHSHNTQSICNTDSLCIHTTYIRPMFALCTLHTCKILSTHVFCTENLHKHCSVQHTIAPLTRPRRCTTGVSSDCNPQFETPFPSDSSNHLQIRHISLICGWYWCPEPHQGIQDLVGSI